MALWVDKSGYFYSLEEDFIDDSLLLTKYSESAEKDSFFSTASNDKLFFNAGGTIVSKPSPLKNLTGVTPISNLVQEVKEIKQLGYDYHPGIKKLSEDFTLEDYKEIETFISETKKTNLVVSHGTDYVTTFSVWMDLLAKRYHKKILVLVSQRSLDKPTSDLVLLLKAAQGLFKKPFLNNAFVFTRNRISFELHSPYQIKKYDTFKKNCFYSDLKISFKNFTELTSLKRIKSTFREDYLKLAPNAKINVEHETFFIPCKDPNSIKIGSGIGNLKSPVSGNKVFSRCLSGPLNKRIYEKNLGENVQYMSIDVSSWEALEALENFRCHLK